jgi:hypothetical protein
MVTYFTCLVPYLSKIRFRCWNDIQMKDANFWILNPMVMSCHILVHNLYFRNLIWCCIYYSYRPLRVISRNFFSMSILECNQGWELLYHSPYIVWIDYRCGWWMTNIWVLYYKWLLVFQHVCATWGLYVTSSQCKFSK